MQSFIFKRKVKSKQDMNEYDISIVKEQKDLLL